MTARTKTTDRGAQRAAVYLRISRDMAGQELGVERQLGECTTLAAHLGLTIVGDPYVDNDTTAKRNSRTGKLKPRPAYLRLLEDVRAGKVDAIVCWDTDRLNRDQRELEQLIDALNTHDVPVFPTQSGPLDLTTAGGRMVARVLGAVAVHESEHKAERQRAQKLQLREHGAWTGGPTPYGYCLARSADGFPSLAIVEGEAVEVRRMVDDVLAGISLRRIAADLTARGVAAPRGGHWAATQVRAVVLRPATAGLRSHEGVVQGAANWPAIVDRGRWELACATLQAPERHTGRSKTRRWLCPDLVQNDAGERGHVTGNGSKARFYAVPGASFAAERLDAAVWEYCLQVSDAGVGRPDDAPLPTDELAALETKLAKLGDMVAAEQMDMVTAGRLSMLLREQISTLKAERAQVAVTPGRLLDLLELPGALRARDAAGAVTFTDRRIIVLALVASVTIRGRWSKLDRLVIEPREQVR